MTDARSKYASAREWLASSERAAQIEREAAAQHGLMERSRRWLERYLARPRRTSFYWSPMSPMTVPVKNRDGANNESTEGPQEGKG